MMLSFSSWHSNGILACLIISSLVLYLLYVGFETQANVPTSSLRSVHTNNTSTDIIQHILPHRKVMVLSVSSFHYEISLFYAWYFHSRQYAVHFYTTPLPMFNYFSEETMKYVCDKFQSLPIKFLPLKSPFPKSTWDAMVFITADREIDYLTSHRYLSVLQTLPKDNPLILVNHYADKVMRLVEFCRKYHPANCLIVHLANHTYWYAQEVYNIQTVIQPMGGIALTYMYPVFNLTETFHLPPAIDKHIPESPAILKMNIQGMASNSRRNYDSLFHSLQHNKSTEVNTFDNWEMHILGRNAKELAIPRKLESHTHIHTKLGYADYYDFLQQGDVTLALLKSAKDYDTVRATSTLPTAIMTSSPVFLTKQFLQLYPCLHTANTGIHALWAQRAEDVGETNILQIIRSPAEIALAKAEVQQCFRAMLRQQDAVFRQLIDSI